MRKFNTLTFNEETWLIQEVPSNPQNLSIYKNGFKQPYFLSTVIGKLPTEDYPRCLGYKLYNSTEGKYDFVKDLFETQINFNLMVDVVATLQKLDKK